MNDGVNPIRAAIRTENEDILIFLREKQVDLNKQIKGSNAINYARTNRVSDRTIQILRSTNVSNLKKTIPKKISQLKETSKLLQKQKTTEIEQINNLPQEIIEFLKYYRSHPDDSIVII